MDNLKEELIESVTSERGRSVDVLLYLRQVQKESRHLAWGHSSLFSLCREELGFSENESTVRIQALRLIKVVPEAERALRDRKLSLTVASLVGRLIRREKLSAEKAREIYETVKGTSKRAADRKLAELFPSKQRRERAKPVDGNTVEVRLNMTHEEWVCVQELMNHRAHSNFERSPGKLFAQLAREALEKIKAKQAEDAPPHCPGTAVALGKAEQLGRSRKPRAKLKRAVWRRDEGKCQFPGCKETHGLQLDHIQPWSQGGLTAFENLRLLCGAHNRWRNEN